MKLAYAQTIALGGFNPQVITPSWLGKYGIRPSDAQLNVRLDTFGELPSFDLVAEEFGRVNWQVNGQLLNITCAGDSLKPKYNCGHAVARVLELLPHTPVQAIGHNFQYTASSDDWGQIQLPQLSTRSFGSLQDSENVRWTGVFQRRGARLEISLAQEQSLLSALFNYHRGIDLIRAMAANSPQEQVRQAIDAADQFYDDALDSLELLMQLLGV